MQLAWVINNESSFKILTRSRSSKPWREIITKRWWIRTIQRARKFTWSESKWVRNRTQTITSLWIRMKSCRNTTLKDWHSNRPSKSRSHRVQIVRRARIWTFLKKIMIKWKVSTFPKHPNCTSIPIIKKRRTKIINLIICKTLPMIQAEIKARKWVKRFNLTWTWK